MEALRPEALSVGLAAIEFLIHTNKDIELADSGTQ
jgi:hypothetical protein